MEIVKRGVQRVCERGNARERAESRRVANSRARLPDGMEKGDREVS